MQEVQPQPLESSGKIALREGAIVGGVVGVVYLAVTVIPAEAVAGLLFVLLVLLWLAAYFVAGMRASKRTALVSTGTLAGLWTALIAGLIALIVSLVLDSLNLDALRESFQQTLRQQMPDTYNGFQFTNQAAIALSALGNICLLLLGIAVGAGLGALGGLLGKSQSPWRLVGPRQNFPAHPPFSSPPGSAVGETLERQEYPSTPTERPPGE
jgi:hypothetical protein